MAEKDESPKKDASEVPNDEHGNTASETFSENQVDESGKAPVEDNKKNGNEKATKNKSEITVESLQQQLDIEKDRLLRLSAEFENYKKRSAREITEFKKYANETVFKQLLTVVDNLERAIVSGEESEEPTPLLEGVKLTHKEILKIFDKFNVKPVDAEETLFDPSYHQAVTHQESAEHPDNTVIKELQKGYTLNDRLIRPSMVIVSKSVKK